MTSGTLLDRKKKRLNIFFSSLTNIDKLSNYPITGKIALTTNVIIKIAVAGGSI